MPDFHDPQTREQMEMEGWDFHYNTLSDRKGFCDKDKGGWDATVYSDGHFLLEHEGNFVCAIRFTSFAAALKAANAILEGVEG